MMEPKVTVFNDLPYIMVDPRTEKVVIMRGTQVYEFELPGQETYPMEMQWADQEALP